MSIVDLSPSALQAAVTHHQELFARGDVEAIVKDFADDVQVQYGSIAPFTGKAKLRQLLQRCFATMENYQPTKRVEFIDRPRYAASWVGSWTDKATGLKMEIFGLEVLTVRDGKFTEWRAGVSTWRSGEALQV
jgi:ketosteroid isomerase-like protein